MTKTSPGINVRAEVPPPDVRIDGPFSSPPAQSLLMGRGKAFSAIWFLQQSGSKLLGTRVLSQAVEREHMALSTQGALLALNAIVKIA